MSVDQPQDRSEGATSSAPPPVRRRRHQRPRRVRWVALCLVGLFILGLGWYEIHVHPVGGPGAPVTIQVTPGESYKSAVSTLAEKRVVSNGVALSLFNLIHGTPTLTPGFFTIHKNSSYQAVNDILGNQPNTVALDVPPGFTISEIETRLQKISNPTFAKQVSTVFSNGTIRSPFEPTGSNNLEGLVAPGVYVLPPGSTANGLVTSMVTRFDAMAVKAGLTPSTVKGSFNAYSLVTAASVVEKEGYYKVNMPKVATVIYNRIAAGIPLQMNATVLYALHQDGGTFTSSDLTYQSPYNSYLNHGLVPTPICSPSQEALDAIMNPPAGTWLYFVLVNKNGTMAFSDTYAEQLANEKIAAERGL